MTKKTWSPDIFDALFQKNPDPWNFENSLYEQEKLSRLLSCLPKQQINFCVELGCAVGVGTKALAARCGRVLAVDASSTALHMARNRCSDLKNVKFFAGFLPEDYPISAVGGCDVIVISEVLYFMAPGDIKKLVERIMESLSQAATLMTVNWTGETDTPCTGDEAAECFIQACHQYHWVTDHTERGETYRLDRLRYAAP
ncbi:SAM-dependent methyltransferase [Acetobacter senegalensis]|uniref:SAM-dependent methyltransferase n=1 Tax=Acetobacter senegalensis TaxID=446692 RepID=UPI001EDBADE3|nr:class I SAM-dependent methyltransferase [Acetobacter senegalensis]MCG4272991.1 nodulation S family protein [Acetobacter senegalensis]